jgi:MFS family permease
MKLKLERLPTGMRTFAAVWFSQMISMIGTGIAEFGVGVWVYQKTGSATLFAMILLFTVLPGIVVSPIAGPLVDRWDRRKTMIWADTGAALSTLSIILWLLAGNLQVWWIMLAITFASVCRTFQGPAWSASTTLLVPEEHLGRASGMMNFARSLSQIGGPLLGGLLVGLIGLEGVAAIDLATFVVAVGALLVVRFPPVPRSAEAAAQKPGLLSEAAYGWRYIWERRSLRAHLAFFAVINLGLAFLWALFPPLVLSFTKPAMLGIVGSSVGFGMLVGSMVMTAWGGPKRRVMGILGVGVLFGVCLILMGLRPWVPLIAASMFGITFGIPLLNGCFMRLWQPRIAPDVQGRTFAAIQVMVWSTEPIAYLTAGPLADRVFRPLLLPGGPLASTVGVVLGTGPGRGIGLMLVIVGALMLLWTGFSALSPHFHSVEREDPVTTAAAPAPAPADDEVPAGEPTPVPA